MTQHYTNLLSKECFGMRTTKTYVPNRRQTNINLVQLRENQPHLRNPLTIRVRSSKILQFYTSNGYRKHENRTTELVIGKSRPGA